MTQEEFFEEWNPETGSIIARTSGSTGKPKEIRLSAEIVLASAERTNRFFVITSRSWLHVPLDFNYIAAKMMGVRASVSGAKLTSEVPSNRPMSDRVRFRPEDKIDLLAVVPSQMDHILNHLQELPELGAVIIGGGALPETLKRRIIDSGLNAWETYGMTETASHIALRRVGEEWFRVMEGIKVFLADNGCLCIEVSGLPQLHTNDIAIINPSDSCQFKILGRADNVINTGGKKVYPEEIESLLSTVWHGLTFAITSCPDEKWGERIIAVIERTFQNPENPDFIPQLLEATRSVLPPHMVPKEIRFLPHLPRTSNGKINRPALHSAIL